ncbi:MAG: hypothetical protein ACK6DZ_06925, partial [Acidobacteriota bacterium]
MTASTSFLWRSKAANGILDSLQKDAGEQAGWSRRKDQRAPDWLDFLAETRKKKQRAKRHLPIRALG